MAVISRVRICNMALSHVGANSNIESLTENSAEAAACDLWYDFSRLQTLEANDWGFARRRLTLATHSDDPPDGVWAYRYQYPSDSVIVRKIQSPAGENAEPIPWEVETSEDQSTKTILTDLSEAIAVYTFDLEDVNLFSAFFVEMLSFALANHIAFTLTGKQSVEESMRQKFASMARIAPASNANERGERQPREASWIEGR